MCFLVSLLAFELLHLDLNSLLLMLHLEYLRDLLTLNIFRLQRERE